MGEGGNGSGSQVTDKKNSWSSRDLLQIVKAGTTLSLEELQREAEVAETGIRNTVTNLSDRVRGKKELNRTGWPICFSYRRCASLVLECVSGE